MWLTKCAECTEKPGGPQPTPGRLHQHRHTHSASGQVRQGSWARINTSCISAPPASPRSSRGPAGFCPYKNPERGARLRGRDWPPRTGPPGELHLNPGLSPSCWSDPLSTGPFPPFTATRKQDLSPSVAINSLKQLFKRPIRSKH